MPAERSLLQRIREKELQLSIKLDMARRDSDEGVRTGLGEAAQMLQTAEQEAAREAEAVFKNEMEGIQREIGEMRDRGRSEADRERQRGEGNLEKAVERIVHHVIQE
jgi:vacuolar-type H+-ATPase subunit H